MGTTKRGFVVGYFVFVGFLLLLIPYLDANSQYFSYSGALPTDNTIPQFNILDPIGFISELASRFTILLTLSSSNIFLGIIFGAYTFGFFWTLMEMLRGN